MTKCYIKACLAFIMSAIMTVNATAQNEENNTVAYETTVIDFTEYFRDATENVQQDVIEVVTGGYRIRFSSNGEKWKPAYSTKGYMALKNGNLIEVQRIDGKNMTAITFDMITEYNGSALNYASPVFYGTDKSNGKFMDDGWKGNAATVAVELVFGPDFGNWNSKYYYFPTMSITAEAAMSMNLTMNEAMPVGSRTAIASFTLDVKNDDGIKDFTIVATDIATGAQYCSEVFDRSTFEETPEAYSADGSETDYVINGRAKLTQMNKNAHHDVKFSVMANYVDRESKVADFSPVMDVSTIGATGISDMEVGDDRSACEYFNLQGIRVSDPGKGPVICRQGDRAKVVIIR